jgi:hypothetical protein
MVASARLGLGRLDDGRVPWTDARKTRRARGVAAEENTSVRGYVLAGSVDVFASRSLHHWIRQTHKSAAQEGYGGRGRS